MAVSVSTDYDSNDRQIARMTGFASLGFLKCFAGLAVLVFMLVVLPSIVSLVVSRCHHRAVDDSFRVKATMKDIRVSLGHFMTEYNRSPVPPSETQFLRTEGVLLQSLLGQDKESNPRGIKFIDLPMALDGKSGLTGMKAKDQTISSTTTLTDLWGEKYYLLIEADGDNRIPNPERRPEAIYKYRARAPEFLSSSVIIFSSGPDRDPKTWGDNICSWR